MTSKKDRLSKLGQTVASATAASHDRFAKADITLALEATAGKTPSVLGTEPNFATPSTPVTAPQTQHAPVGERLRVLNIDDVKDHPRNSRKLYDPARLDELAKSLARDEQKVPAIVMADADDPGKYILLDGRYRKRALVSLRRNTILVLVVDPLSELEAYRLSRMLNEERSPQTDLDNALSWREMLDDKIFESQRHICEYLELSEATVSKTLALLELPSNVLAIMKANPGAFGIRVGYELRMLARQATERELEEIVEKLNDNKLSLQELEAMRERKERKPTSRSRSRPYGLSFGEAKLGYMREFEDGRFKLELTSETPADLRAKLKEAVQKVFEEAEKNTKEGG